jgi:hypothetical protein
MNYEIPLPNNQPEWKIGPNDSVTFNFKEDVTHFEVVSHSDYFTPDVPSGGFMNGNVIGPYTANVKGKKVEFKYDPNKDDVADTHTILIGN